ncbi:MAG: DUF4177 domain-containing protein [Firmicutes bacterium]|nr:DUF4177 domain-containing protein [Bacillota bacterium]
MERWEYKTLQFGVKGLMGGILDLERFDGELNRMGNDGWELVTCFDTNCGQGASRFVLAVFKRKIRF